MTILITIIITALITGYFSYQIGYCRAIAYCLTILDIKSKNKEDK